MQSHKQDSVAPFCFTVFSGRFCGTLWNDQTVPLWYNRWQQQRRTATEMVQWPYRGFVLSYGHLRYAHDKKKWKWNIRLQWLWTKTWLQSITWTESQIFYLGLAVLLVYVRLVNSMIGKQQNVFIILTLRCFSYTLQRWEASCSWCTYWREWNWPRWVLPYLWKKLLKDMLTTFDAFCPRIRQRFVASE